MGAETRLIVTPAKAGVFAAHVLHFNRDSTFPLSRERRVGELGLA
ncbi:MAG TPA: hypothetical protein VFK36_00670 [Gemmatimonadales bacterium]|nr:hypothetical protein [Gemmatimonadales bacterium]